MMSMGNVIKRMEAKWLRDDAVALEQAHERLKRINQEARALRSYIKQSRAWLRKKEKGGSSDGLKA